MLTGRGANLIIIDDPLKAGDALSDSKRQGVNDWYDNTLRSRLNNQDDDAIVLVMQRLHADDLVAHVQRTERWEDYLISSTSTKARSGISLKPRTVDASLTAGSVSFCIPLSYRSALLMS